MTLAPSGGDALARQLAEEGVTHVFGVPGQQLYHALDGLARQPTIQFVSTRHEQTAGYMADGYARTTGREGVCMVVPGPGLLNTMAALATAYACSSPVLCIVGQIPSEMIGKRRGVLHEVPNQSGLLDSVTKWHALAGSADEIPGLVEQAFRELRCGRAQPVALEIPPDVLGAPCGAPPREATAQTGLRSEPERLALDGAAAVLRDARRPAIYAGWGAHAADATDELRRLAELLQAPVVMSRSGMGAISLRHPLAATKLAGRKLLPDADVVLVVGSRFRSYAGAGGPSGATGRVIHLDADPAAHVSRAGTDIKLLGDARLGLAGLLDRLQHLPARPSRSAEVHAARAWADAQLTELEPQMSYLRALRRALPDDAIVVSELTQVAYVVRVGFEFLVPRTNVTPGYQGTLGFGFPAALGARIGNPGRTVVSLSGDGGFGYCLAELATARQYGIGAIAVVFNDGGYGNVQREMADLFGGRSLGTRLVNPDFMTLAAAFGVRGARALDAAELESAVREAAALDVPTLIEVPVGPMPDPWPLLR